MQPTVVALVGNPNSGKSTLFNALTGQQEEVGNWCGVTVEAKYGFFQIGETLVKVVDLPGCYYYDDHPNNLAVSDASDDLKLSGSIDEQITTQYLASGEATCIVNVIDATHLERHLYLTIQLLEQGFSVIVVLNMMDELKKQAIEIDVAALANHLSCPVIPLVALKKEGLDNLKKALFSIITSKNNEAAELQKAKARYDFIHQTAEVQKAKARYDFIHQIITETVRHISTCIHTPSITHSATSWTEKIDHIVLHRYLGLPFFLMMMYSVFVFSIHIMGAFQDFFDIASRTIFIEGTERLLTHFQFPFWFVHLMAFGIGQGINTTVTFIPVIAGMFLSLSFLEASGYMARAAFVMDKMMQWVGLPGKSFVPMIMGFGCNVPAIMAARTLESYRERVLTILMTPFMSCSARLAIYAVFVSAFFPHSGQNIIFALYLIGICIALATGFILQGSLLKGMPSPLIIELPSYRWPSLLGIWRTTWHRLKQFLLKAGTLIVLLCVLLGSFNRISESNSENPWVVRFGQSLTPFFAPIGIQEDNWPATVGLVTGILAKEVVVGTLNSLYSQDSQYDPHTGSTGIMAERFGSTAAAFAYLLFVLLYFPCVSVLAVIARELNKRWALFSVVWTTSIAYFVATFFYQASMVVETPIRSMGWISGILGLLGLSFYGIRRWASSKKRKGVPTRIVLIPPTSQERG